MKKSIGKKKSGVAKDAILVYNLHKEVYLNMYGYIDLINKRKAKRLFKSGGPQAPEVGGPSLPNLWACCRSSWYAKAYYLVRESPSLRKGSNHNSGADVTSSFLKVMYLLGLVVLKSGPKELCACSLREKKPVHDWKSRLMRNRRAARSYISG